VRSDLESTFATCYRVDGLDIHISRISLINVIQLYSYYIRQWKSNDHHITISYVHIQKSSLRSIVYHQIRFINFKLTMKSNTSQWLSHNRKISLINLLKRSYICRQYYCVRRWNS
jgi:hypothetical protein